MQLSMISPIQRWLGVIDVDELNQMEQFYLKYGSIIFRKIRTNLESSVYQPLKFIALSKAGDFRWVIQQSNLSSMIGTKLIVIVKSLFFMIPLKDVGPNLTEVLWT
jgi:hypothetical protein